MEKPISAIRIIVWVIICILLGIWIGFRYDVKEPMNNPSMVPLCPDASKPMYYDFNEEIWKYIYREDRAKGGIVPREPYLNEEDLQRYLEKKVDGYIEDTYWGEEYDLEDNENNQ